MPVSGIVECGKATGIAAVSAAGAATPASAVASRSSCAELCAIRPISFSGYRRCRKYSNSDMISVGETLSIASSVRFAKSTWGEGIGAMTNVAVHGRSQRIQTRDVFAVVRKLHAAAIAAIVAQI